MLAFSQGFFSHSFIKAVEAQNKQGFIEDARRRLAQRNPQTEADDYEVILAYAQENEVCKQWAMDPTLDSAWHDCLEDFSLKLEGDRTFYPHPQYSIPAYQQVLANVRFYATSLEMKAKNEDEPHRAWNESISVNLQKASASGSFQATYLLHRHALECLMAAQNQQEVEKHASQLLSIVSDQILSMHGTPAFLLLAETHYVLSLKFTTYGKKFTRDIKIEALILLRLAHKLESYSADAIHNAYLGNDLTTAFRSKQVMARAAPIEFQDWSQYLKDISQVLFPNLSTMQLDLVVKQHHSNAEELCDRYISQWQTHHLLIESMKANA